MSTNVSSRTTIGLDLSGTGAPRSWVGNGDSESEAFIMGRLAGLASLADKGGVDVLTLDSRFRLGSGRRRDDWLDGALAASRLGRHTVSATIVAAVPLHLTDAAHVASAVASVHKATAGRAGWQVDDGSRPVSARSVDAAISALAAPRVSRRTGVDSNGAPPKVIVAVREGRDVELAAARADIARVQATSLEHAIALRSEIRQAATEWGRHPDDVTVLVDVHAVLGAESEGARARAELLELLDGETSVADLRFVGTAGDLADLWQQWVQAGAADGFTVIPASVPTDVLAVVTELIPALADRGLRAETARAVTTPVPARRRAGRPLKVAV